MAKKKRTMYKYKLMKGNQILYIGITNDLKRRAREHKGKGHKGKMKIFGRAVTEESARQWEIAELEKYKRSHGGELPKYNKKIG